MNWNVHEVNLNDFKGVSEDSIYDQIKQLRKESEALRGKHWDLEGAEKIAARKQIQAMELQMDKLELVLEAIYEGEI